MASDKKMALNAHLYIKVYELFAYYNPHPLDQRPLIFTAPKINIYAA